MDALILAANFIHNDNKTRDEFSGALQKITRDMTDADKVGNVCQTLQSLEKRLLGGDGQPLFETEGWEQVMDTYNQISNCFGVLYDSDDSVVAKVHADFFSFLVHILEKKVTPLNLQVACKCVQDRNTDMVEYIQKLEDKKLGALIALCKQMKPEVGVDLKKYSELHQKFMRVLIRDTLTNEQRAAHTSDLLDLSVSLQLDWIDDPGDHLKTLVDTGKMILNQLDEPFIKIKDVSKMKSYLNQSREILQRPSFPSSHIAASTFSNFLDNLVSKLGKNSLVENLVGDVFDLLVDITRCPYHEGEYDVKLFANVFGYFRRLPKLTKNAEVFKAMAVKFTAVLEAADMRFLINERFSYTIVDDYLLKVYADNKEVARSWLEMLVPLLQKPCDDTMRACGTILFHDKGYKWKDFTDLAQRVFDILVAYDPEDESESADENQKKKMEEFYSNFKRTVEYFFEGLKKSRMLKDFGRGMITMSLKLMHKKHKELRELSEVIAERAELNAKDDQEFMVSMMASFHQLLQDEAHLWNESWPLQRAACDFIEHCMEPFKNGKVFSNEELQVFVSICQTCLTYDCVHPDTGQFPSTYFSIFLAVVKGLFKWLTDSNRMNLAEELMLQLMKLTSSEDETVVQLCCVYLIMFGQAASGRNIMAPHLEEIIQIYLDTRQDTLLYTVGEIYPLNPKALKTHFRNLMDLLENTSESTVVTYVGMLFQKVSKLQAELFTDEDIQVLLNKAQESINTQTSLLDICRELCKRRPESFEAHIDLLMDHTLWNSAVSYWITEMLCALAIYSQDLASKVLASMFLTLKSNQEKHILVTSLNAIRMIGFKYPDLLKPKRSQLDQLEFSDVDALNMRQVILDMIDGKTPEEMLSKFQKQQQDLQDLIGRVDETEDLVAEVKDELDLQKQQLGNVTEQVDKQDQVLTDVGRKVDETIAKVEEIDQKTLSHAPYWARDISKLLNPASENDWRLLSSRLGYSNDDIRGWAQHADPCMAMLNEWYAVRKTSEATFAILTQLQEMNRPEAAAIVENAMKNAEAVVEDEEFEYSSPPSIFISYQWFHQAEVKLLKQHLEMAGYECWLDIGQMGGGDKLFEKIDKGIRGAKVMISCVSEKYSKSPNCTREVNLAVSLNKPLIPLMLESCTWPPPGSMGPLFSEFLFIRFYQRKGEELEDQRFWPKEKFQELLMQFNTLGLLPDEGRVKPEYKNWWAPVVEELQIDKKKTMNGGLPLENSKVISNRGPATGTPTNTDESKTVDSPEVFISYQWGKQKNILKLYERLTSLGLTCWLDIKQMGGGDSLYDKIDKGLRGCRVVLSCVTQKYALSPNCRREVSLADALKKPMVPLLLEKMAWPPTGPMGMVLTQLLYIDFTKDESVQTSWEGPQFQQLLSKIESHVPKAVPMNKALQLQPETQIDTIIAATISANNGITNIPKSEADTETNNGITNIPKSEADTKTNNGITNIPKSEAETKTNNASPEADGSLKQNDMKTDMTSTSDNNKSGVSNYKATTASHIPTRDPAAPHLTTTVNMKPAGPKPETRKPQARNPGTQTKEMPPQKSVRVPLSTFPYRQPRPSHNMTGVQKEKMDKSLSASSHQLLQSMSSEPIRKISQPAKTYIYPPRETHIKSEHPKLPAQTTKLPPLKNKKPSPTLAAKSSPTLASKPSPVVASRPTDHTALSGTRVPPEITQTSTKLAHVRKLGDK